MRSRLDAPVAAAMPAFAVACLVLVIGCQSPLPPSPRGRDAGAKRAGPRIEKSAHEDVPAPAPEPAPPKDVPIAQPAAWDAIECPEVDRTVAQQFQPGAEIDSFDTGLGGWRAFQGGQQARSTLALDDRVKHAGAASMRVEFEFTGDKKLEYVNFGREIAIPARGSGLGMMVKTDGTRLGFRLRVVDKSGETHQLDFAGETTTEWGFVAVMYDGHSGSWGGDGNKRLDYPCRVQSIVADRPKRGYTGKGSIWIDSVASVSKRTFAKKMSVEVGDKRFGNVYRPGEALHVRAKVDEGAVRWRLEDYFGARLADGGDGTARAACAHRLAKQGFHQVVFERVGEGGRVEEGRMYKLAVLPPDIGWGNDVVCFCSHFRWGAYPLSCMDLMKRYGFRRFRDEIAWRSFEEQPKRYVMPKYGQALIDRARALEMKPLLILDYSNKLYDNDGFPNSAEAIAAYAAHGVEMARLTRGVVDEFEIWNEWIHGCGMKGKPGDHSPEAYGRILKPTYEAMKRAYPDVTVVGMGGFCRRPFPEMVERAISTSGPQAMDAISIHPYRYPRQPEASDLVGEVVSVADKARELGAPPKIWASEIGWPTHLGQRGVDERTQARYIVRTMALLQASGVVERVYWYDFKNDGLKREYNENNFGVVYHQKLNCAPKPAVVAASVFARLTAGATPKGITRDGRRRAARYRMADGKSLLVAWATEGETRATITGSVERILDTMGNACAASNPLVLTEDPAYLVGGNLTLGSE